MVNFRKKNNFLVTFTFESQRSTVVVAAHLRGMWPASATKKDTLMLRKNSKTNTLNQTLNYLLLDYF